MKNNKSRLGVNGKSKEVSRLKCIPKDFKVEGERIVRLFKRGNINLDFDDTKKRVFLDKYTLYYSSKSAVIQTLEEVFVNMPYYFQTDLASPFIVDAGSEVGIATIFFKIFYPDSKVLCFEAHPDAFSLLKKNIETNRLKGVEVVNAALTNKDGVIDFFGEFSSSDLDTRGSSIIKEWGLQRDTSTMVQVKAVKLSKYIKSRVDFLKLNVEGAEHQIFEDLEKNNKMRFINRILLKFHYSQKTQDINNLDFICELFSRENIKITNRIIKNPELIFPKITKGWAAENKVQLQTISAKRIGAKDGEKIKNVVGELNERFILLKKSCLEDESAMLRKIIDNLPSSLYWKDRDGKYLGHSAYALRQLHSTDIAPDVTAKNIIGKSDYDIFSKDVADRYRENDLYVMESKKDFILEEITPTPSGKKLIQLSSKKPLYDDNGNVIGIIGSTIDITERRQAEKLEIKSKMYKKQLREQEKFRKIANQVAHDIRSPLTSLAVIVESCKSIPEADRITLRKIAISISDIANNLSSKYKSDDLKTHTAQQIVQPMAVSLALLEVLSEKKYQYKESPVKFTYSCKKDANFAFVNVEPVNFKRMMSNLLNNAVESSSGKDSKVKIECKLNSKFVNIIIQDNGNGIPKDVLDKIMNGISVTNGKENGSGIGLIQVRETLKNNNGTMSIDTKISQGTKITLSFPKIKTPSWIADQIKLNKGDIVVVLDDDDSIHYAWELRLKAYESDIELKHFKLGYEAFDFINAIEQKNKICLLSDYELIGQEFDGMQVIEQTSMQQFSFLVTSHYADQGVLDIAIEAGVKILPKQLVSVIPIVIEEEIKSLMGDFKKVGLVIIDDNKLLVDSLIDFFQNFNMVVDGYHEPKDFLNRLSQYSKDTKICMDNDFCVRMTGIELAKRLHKAGYSQLYLFTGKDFGRNKVPSYLKVITKGNLVELKKLVLI